jgi:non-lysosomal glucosylceramidase
MSRNTARGIHDAGWQEYGYWFATPEGWESSGNYRSLGYMRPLCIWAIQFAKEQA